MNHLTNTRRLLLATFALLILTGCLGLEPKPDPSRYYVLGEAESTAATRKTDCKKTVLVGPVTLPGYLDNPKIARRRGENEIEYVAWNFWAAPLNRAVPRELVSALDRELADVCVFSYRKASPDEDSVKLEVLVEKFEMTDNETVVLVGRWNVTSNTDQPKRQGTAKISRSYEPGTDSMVSGVQALTMALGELAKKIANDLR